MFDLDGTLTDPKKGIVNSIKYALSKYGINEDDEKYLEKFIGPPLYESFKKYYFFDDKEVNKVVEYYREYFSDYGMYENKIYPGIKELLESLNKANRKLVVATSKPTVFAKKILEHFKLERYFFDVIGSNLNGTRVSKVEIIETALKSTGDPKNKAVMIGDREYDIIGAKDNEIYCIGVLYGYGEKSELESAYPDYIVKDVSELRELLLKDG